MPSKLGNSSSIKTLNVLEYLSKQVEPVSASKIATGLGMERATVYRSLYSLVETGFAIKTLGASTYILSVKTHLLSRTVEKILDGNKYIDECVSEISNKLGDHCLVTTQEGADAVVVHAVFSDHGGDIAYGVGDRGKIFCTAAGKALISKKPMHVTSEILKEGLSKQTDRTLTDPFKYLKVLEKCKEDNFALDIGEAIEGINCISVPIYDPLSKNVYAITMVGTDNNLPKKIAIENATYIKEQIKGLEQKLQNSGT